MSISLCIKTAIVSIFLWFLSLSMTYTVSAVSFDGSILWYSSYFTFTTIDFADPIGPTIDVVTPAEVQIWDFYDAATSFSYPDQTASLTSVSMQLITDAPTSANPEIGDMIVRTDNFTTAPPAPYDLIQFLYIELASADIIVRDYYLGLSPWPTSFENLASSALTSPINPVPEPATILLLGIGLLGIAGATRRKFKN